MDLQEHRLKNVLIIDDDDDYNFIIEEFFEDADIDCNLTFKMRAQEALAYLEANKDNFPDMILLDINMPVMDGWEFLKTYESLNYHLTEPTIIFMHSSSVFQEDKDKAQTFKKVVEFIDKPISVSHIKRIRDSYFS